MEFDDYKHVRMLVMVEMLAQTIQRTKSADSMDVPESLSGATLQPGTFERFHAGTVCASDQQLQQFLVFSAMGRLSTPGVRHDVEGSGCGLRTVRRLSVRDVQQPHTCRMMRPAEAAFHQQRFSHALG